MRPNRLSTFLGVVPTILAWTHTDESELREAIKAGEPRLVAFIDVSTLKSLLKKHLTNLALSKADFVSQAVKVSLGNVLTLKTNSDARSACKALEPEWTSIADQEGSPLLSVDCTSKPQLCKEFDVISYPALRYFNGNGIMTPYRGPRESSFISSFLRRASRPTISTLDEQALKTFPRIDDTVFIAHVNPSDTYVDVLFQAEAETYHDRASFGATGTSGATSIICYNNRNEESAVLSDLTAIDAIPKFIKSCMEPLVGEFTRVTESKYLQPGKSLVYYLAATFQERDAYVDSIRPVAKKYREFLNFVTVDATEYADLTLPLGLPYGTFPALAIQNPVYGQVFPYPPGEKITPETVEGFVIEISQGKVEPWNGIRPVPPNVQHDEL